MWSVLTKEFIGQDGAVSGVRTAEIVWHEDGPSGRMRFEEVPGSELRIEAQLVLLALGYTREGNADALRELGIETDENGDVVLDSAGTSSLSGVFVAGDFRQGASLVVRAIAEGRRAAEAIDRYVNRAGS